jgi:hypothetical protein
MLTCRRRDHFYLAAAHCPLRSLGTLVERQADRPPSPADGLIESCDRAASIGR